VAERIPARLSPAEGRKFAFPVGTAFLLLGALLWWRGPDLVGLLVAMLGMLLIVAGAVVPARLGPVYRAWMRGAVAISRVTTPLFLGLTYFVVFVPIGLAMRLLGRNPVVHRATDGSYWVQRSEPAPDPQRMKRQF
jgi:hypothetical protein